MSLPLFLDCDPGIDDAIALGYLLCQDDVDIVGIAASGGNVPTAQVFANTRAWLALAGRADLPVHPGSDLPLRLRDRSPGSPAPEIEYADLTHGPAGLGYARLEEPSPSDSGTSAAQAWVDAARAHPGELIGVVIGPATNLALAMEIEPRLPTLLRRVFLMGGAFNYRGNTWPTTEWNVTFDPESTAAVLAGLDRAREQDWSVALPVIAPIEATEAVEMTPERLARILEARPEGAWGEFLHQLGEALRFYFEFHESDGLGYLAHIHDPFVVACAIAWARRDDGDGGDLPWSTTATAPVGVELTGTLTRGETVADWLGRWGLASNAEIIRSIDAPAFLEHLENTLTNGPHHG